MSMIIDAIRATGIVIKAVDPEGYRTWAATIKHGKLPVILLNKDQSLERQRFTAARSFGLILLERSTESQMLTHEDAYVIATDFAINAVSYVHIVESAESTALSDGSGREFPSDGREATV